MCLKFLNKIDEGGGQYVSQWVLDPNNPVKRGVSVIFVETKKYETPLFIYLHFFYWVWSINKHINYTEG